ncbi:AAA family ATPase [Paenisporosarcina quisquiliarum]|uniref:AAA family ATPase n=1 Tax=Paenisporosarcina quisquiliarum TaxID=365346 RepID=A0A9X3LFK4_9BACL|nr:AAA family ATPase [Paenisporosarcina quisquiliarum]MCZ8537110.1 AAA family ATPase [Paenisporosarcina quisquiliarum]
MYLANLTLWNFRKYGTTFNGDGSHSPGLSLRFNSKLNLLVGENDAGKTGIISAIKMVLNTHSNDFRRPDTEDFYLEPGKEEHCRCTEFKIECTFKDLSNMEAKNFLEWLSFEENDTGDITYYLKLTFIANREGRNITYDLRVGTHEGGSQINGKARDLLKTTFLKPLRDSESELTSRRNSRLSQILYNHGAFSNEDDHELIRIIKEANKSISNYFQGVDLTGNPITDSNGKELLEELNTYLSSFSREGNLLVSNFNIADTKLKSILEKLSLHLFSTNSGLGSQNLLFIATELLLLKRDDFTGLKLALIEEIEAHLHPQSQALLIEYLEATCNDSNIQMILTTHSPNLASKVSIENIIICKNNGVFNMSAEDTELRKGDYAFLQRFLDVTKSNMFFANGVIMVEGDAENILIPVIAKIIGVPLSKHGISITNVGSTAFLRYSGIFLRKEEHHSMGVRVACITDLDVVPVLNNSKNYILQPEHQSLINCLKQIKEKKFEGDKTYNKQRKEALYSNRDVKCYVSKSWTLEYCIALSHFREEFFKAVKYAEFIQNSEKHGLTEVKMEKGNEFIKVELEKWDTEKRSNEEIAYYIYNDYMLNKKISKAIVAQCFGNLLAKMDPQVAEKRITGDENLRYLVNAIKYAAGLGEDE